MFAMQLILPYYQAWCSHSGVSENSGLRRCDTVSSTTRIILDCLTLEDGG